VTSTMVHNYLTYGRSGTLFTTLYIPSTSLACESEDFNPNDSSISGEFGPDSGEVRSDVTDFVGLDLHNPTSNNYS
jgi:hypothetical protein